MVIERKYNFQGGTFKFVFIEGVYRMGKFKLVCFDLDDTLIRDIHSVMLPCILNGKEKEHSFIQAQEEKGVIDYILADYLRAKLLIIF